MHPTDSATFADTAVILTFRAAHPSRVAALATVLRHYAQWPELQVVLVEQDAQPSASLPPLPANAQHLFVVNRGVFSKSWGQNVGARHADRSLLLLADADMLLAPQALLKAARLCRQRAVAAKPFDRQTDLDEAQTAAIVDGSTAANWERDDGRTTRREHEQINFCSGAVMIRRANFLALGGFDERFVGWGGEDDALAMKLRRSGQPLARVDGSTALHLWHPQDRASTFEQPHYAANVAVLDSLRTLDEAAFRFLCDVQRQLLGHARKYELASAAVSLQPRSKATTPG